MIEDLRLFLYNISYLFSALTSIAITVLTITKGGNKALKITVSLAFFSITVFCLTNFFGVNIKDTQLSNLILSFNLSVIFISVFVAHSIFLAIGKVRKYIIPLVLIYILSFVLFIFLITFTPDFMPSVRPKMYFPNYSVPGQFSWTMVLFSDILVPIYLFMVLLFEYFKAQEPLKSKIKFLFLMFFTGYIVGSGVIPLVYDFPIDPLIGAPFVLIGGIFFAYGSTFYELMEIKIIAKNAFIYALLTSTIGLILGGLNYLNAFFPVEYYHFLSLSFSFLIAAILVATGSLIFKQIRASDNLKYEFMTIMMHKFLTPLNRIKWSIEELKNGNVKDQENFVSIISRDNDRLIEMMKLLASISDSTGFQKNLRSTPLNPKKEFDSILQTYQKEFSESKLTLKTNLSESGLINMPLEEFRLILETIIDNCIKYTPAKGTINVSITSNPKKIDIAISDTGIGISKEDLPYIFKKFFRGENAKKAYTEGMGVGLSTVKNIIKRNKGKITAFSKGAGQGTTFIITLPIYTKTESSPVLKTPQTL